MQLLIKKLLSLGPPSAQESIALGFVVVTFANLSQRVPLLTPLPLTKQHLKVPNKVSLKIGLQRSWECNGSVVGAYLGSAKGGTALVPNCQRKEE